MRTIYVLYFCKISWRLLPSTCFLFSQRRWGGTASFYWSAHNHNIWWLYLPIFTGITCSKPQQTGPILLENNVPLLRTEWLSLSRSAKEHCTEQFYRDTDRGLNETSKRLNSFIYIRSAHCNFLDNHHHSVFIDRNISNGSISNERIWIDWDIFFYSKTIILKIIKRQKSFGNNQIHVLFKRKIKSFTVCGRKVFKRKKEIERDREGLASTAQTRQYWHLLMCPKCELLRWILLELWWQYSFSSRGARGGGVLDTY